jgi:protein-ribulosamine 3-kinase
MFDQAGQYEDILFSIFGKPTAIEQFRLVAGGSLNQTVYLSTEQGDFLLKTNFESRRDIFPKEASGLELLRKHAQVKIPEVFGFGTSTDLNYLLMEWLPEERPSADYWEALGQGLAGIHIATSSNFGLEEDNYIATLPQINTQGCTWPDFFTQHRLEPMVGKAYYDGLISAGFLDKFKQIYPKLPELFPKEKPALLHGDLWSGNVMVTAKGLPALIDPAVYYGHREVDLAFSKLFGGFEQRFYDSYHESFPLEPGFEQRVDLYNLYPLLVHLNLFGSSYLPPIERTINRLLR